MNRRLFIYLFVVFCLFLWAFDMVHPWPKTSVANAWGRSYSLYDTIQKRKKLIVGTLINPVSYFLETKEQSGLEYDLSKAFAQYLHVDLEIKILTNRQELFDALEKHKIDIAAANLQFDPKKTAKFQFGPSYYSASWQLVYRKGSKRPKDLKNLHSGLVITKGSGLNGLLLELKDQYPKLHWKVVNKPQETLLFEVAKGDIPYTIANSMDVASAQQIEPNIAPAFDIADEASVHWYIANSRETRLQAALLDFIHQSMEDGSLARIEEKYVSHLKTFDYVDTRAYVRAIKDKLPQYQPLFEKYQGDLNWQLLASVAYQESHWNPNATSPTGVRGMMMLTKATAERMKVTNRLDPKQSIEAGSAYIHLLLNQMPEAILEEDRIWFALAAYNMGLGHLLDVRHLTKELGGDPNNWLDVKNNLPLLSQKEYYKKLKYGHARGYEAFQYVENVRRYLNIIRNYLRVQQQELEALENESKDSKLKEEKDND